MDIDVYQKRAEMLLDTIQYYASDPNRRAAGEHLASCKFYDKKTGNRCAVGRYMNLDDYEESWEVSGWEDLARAGAIPPDVLALGTGFLEALQCLHDEDIYWLSSTLGEDVPGLNDSGIADVRDIDYTYCEGILQKSLGARRG